MNPLRNLVFNKLVGAVEDFLTSDGPPKGRPAADSDEKSNPKNTDKKSNKDSKATK